jgi:cellulose synthase/poly-beta-1,6-N-acetylglucosamine synthase-like glycosyltransferase
MHSPIGAGLKTRVAEFAWAVKNLVRPSGLHRLGLPCQLMGTGMAFPWACLSSANLATGHIVEDLILGIEMTRAKRAPLFCPEASVTSVFPSSNEGIESQRARWEHGHLGILLVEAPKLFWDACKRRDIKLLSTALDLSIPPLALLILMVAAVWASSAVAFVFTKSAAALALATLEALVLAATVIAAWLAHGRRIISLRDLTLASIYVVWKIPIYAKFFVARQVTWVRSRRDTEGQ